MKRAGICPQSPAKVGWSSSFRNAPRLGNQSVVSGKTLCIGLKRPECRFLAYEGLPPFTMKPERILVPIDTTKCRPDEPDVSIPGNRLTASSCQPCLLATLTSVRIRSVPESSDCRPRKIVPGRYSPDQAGNTSS